MADQTFETATLAGGCFWCLEAVFQAMEGVREVTSGYMGGPVDNPNYEQVCRGDTGHAEVVRLVFDPQRTSYEQLLRVFFTIHDPTTPDRQGNDVGSQYRSAIFFHTPDQEAIARHQIETLGNDSTHGSPIVTQVMPASRFWPAEDYHRDYFARHRQQPYCQFVVAPKVDKFRHHFPDWLKPSP